MSTPGQRRPAYDLTQPGWAILIAISVLLAVGVASIYVSDTHYTAGRDGPRNAAKQCLFLLVSLTAAALVLRTGYRRIADYAYPIFLVALAALVPLLVARLLDSTLGGLVPLRNGAHRWINLPAFQLQPSEFMKLAYILALAWYLRHRKNYRRLGGLLLPILATSVPLGLILLQPDLGTVLLLLPVPFVMLFMAGARKRHLAVILLIGLAAVPLMWGQLRPYQRARVSSVLLQSKTLRQAVIEKADRFRFLATKRQAKEWAASSGYQLVHSKNALGSGQTFGHGWGNGVYVDRNLLPDKHNDFIFSIVGHQWGFAGCLLVLLCYVVIVLAGVRIAAATTEAFGRLLAVGVVALIAAQAIISVGMSIGLMPITGMTLPFVSYGGSSLLANFLAAALLVSVSQHRPFLLSTRPFEFARPREEKPHLAQCPGLGPPSSPTSTETRDGGKRDGRSGTAASTRARTGS